MSGNTGDVGMMAEESRVPDLQPCSEEEQHKDEEVLKDGQESPVSYSDPILPSPLDYPSRKDMTNGQPHGAAQCGVQSPAPVEDQNLHIVNAQDGTAPSSQDGVDEAHHCYSMESSIVPTNSGNPSEGLLDSGTNFTVTEEKPFNKPVEQCTLTEEDLKKPHYEVASDEGLISEVGTIDGNVGLNQSETHEGLEHIGSLTVANVDNKYSLLESAQTTSEGSSEALTDHNLKQPSNGSVECSGESSTVDSNEGIVENSEHGNLGIELDNDLKELSDSASTDNTGEDSVDFSGISSVVGGVTSETSPPTSPVLREDDVTAESWRTRRRHVFVLSEAGKPIYSRYGNEEALSSTMGVMMALVSFVQSGNNSIRSIHSENQKVVFLQQGPLVLVSVSRGPQSEEQLRRELQYVYYQIISMLTQASVARIFERKKNYDLRRLLAGSEKILDSLLDLLDTDPGFLLGAVRCLTLPNSLRDSLSSILTKAITPNLVFSILVADHQLVTVVQERAVIEDCRLDPADLHLLLNLISASSAFQAGEIWTPICLPRFNPDGYFYAYISYLDPQCTVCLVLLSTDKESFYAVSGCKRKIQEAMEAQNSLQTLSNAMQSRSYSVSLVGVPELLHFVYKPMDIPEPYRQLPQFTSPEPDGPYSSEEERQRLFDLYRYLHCRIHSTTRPLRLIYHVAEKETMLAWVTSKFELYTSFSSLVTKVGAINVITKLLRWIKREEDRLFIRYPPKYSTTPLPGKGGKASRTDRTDPSQNGYFTGL
ncbi:vacuolar fusion protein MON1 homolog B-like [Hyperolius riggenbachi]|uniref:vacuolar fusion protein MON1 homolog B-like n=1 Tax=Hyperolius riggenbachi TaxID=752182 RepID=UPI0035A2ACFD